MRPARAADYLLSALLVLALTGVKLAVPEFRDRLPFILYFGAVVFAAWRFGRGPAALVIAMSAFASHYLFLGRLGAFSLERAALMQTAIYVAEAAAVSELCQVLRNARAQAADAATKLTTTLRSIGDAVIATDARGTVTFMNGVAEKLTGWTEAEARGRPLPEVFHVVDEATRERLDDPATRVLREGRPTGLPNPTVLVANGSELQTAIDDSVAPIRDASGEVRGAVLVFRDVGREKWDASRRDVLADTASALAGSLDYRTTLTTVANLIVPRLADWCAIEMVDEDTGKSEQLVVCHSDPAKVAEAWELRAKYPPDPDAPTGVQRVLRTARSEHYPDISDEMLGGAARDAEHLRLLRRLQLRSAMVVPLVARGKTLGAITMVHAESGRRYGEDDLAFAEQLAERAALAADNARLFTRERDARETADAAMRLKDEFLATLSHELRTPLTSILGWARMLTDGILDEPKRQKAFSTIHRNAVAMAQLVDDLLDVSRIISGKLPLEARPVTLAPLVQAAIDAIRSAAQAKHIAVRTDLDEAAPVYGDARRLQQIVWNLLSNAIKFTPRDGAVDVVVRREGSSVVLSVADNGPGIAPEFLPFLFGRFHQADASFTRATGGLGLGLAITRHLVELHGGSVEAESGGAGKGATFTVRLPVAAVHEAAPERRRRREDALAVPSGPLEPAVDLTGTRVLVVDDDEDARALVAEVLDGQGCDVRTAPSVEEAMQAFARELPDVVISDIGMPENDGYELIKRIRSRPAEQGGAVPAAALTAYARDADRRRVLDAGYEKHIVKPVDPAKLVAVVADLARFSRAS